MQKYKASQGYREWRKEAALTTSKRLERNGAIQILQGRGSPAEGAAGAQTPEPSLSSVSSAHPRDTPVSWRKEEQVGEVLSGLG